jgi:hypothetical protein
MNQTVISISAASNPDGPYHRGLTNLPQRNMVTTAYEIKEL